MNGNGGNIWETEVYIIQEPLALGSSVGIWLFHEISSYRQNVNRYKGFDQSCNIYCILDWKEGFLSWKLSSVNAPILCSQKSFYHFLDIAIGKLCKSSRLLLWPILSCQLWALNGWWGVDQRSTSQEMIYEDRNLRLISNYTQLSSLTTGLLRFNQ